MTETNTESNEIYQELYGEQDRNLKLQRKHRNKALMWLGGAALVGSYVLTQAWNWHMVDRDVSKHVEIAENGDTNAVSMESSLRTAQGGLSVSPLENTALIWETPYTSTTELNQLLEKAAERAKEIGVFKNAYDTGVVKEDAPHWVHKANKELQATSTHVRTIMKENLILRPVLQDLIPTIDQLAQSEYGQRIGSEYEALNTVVAGGTRTKAKNISESNRSLLDTLQKAAGWRSIVRFQATDYMGAHANVFVGYVEANMGYIDEGLVRFREAKRLMDQYDDDKNLSILRDTPELGQGVIKGLINSSIKELDSLAKDDAKYSTGWWKRLRYFNQSIGGQNNPCLQDMAEVIADKYWLRGMLGCGFGISLLLLGGREVKSYRKALKYKVPTT